MYDYANSDERGLEKLVGKTVNKIYMNEEYLVFETDDGTLAFTVEGDCCSKSYFHDFYGVSNLLGKKVTETGTVSLSTADQAVDDGWNEIKVYGFKIVFDGKYGEQTAVFSFRNSSNGYYGGTMYPAETIPTDVPEITKDTVLV